ncbi:MAG: hypothetical protein SFV51_26640 [Bryobacteraceae bacterium]|nr:hypothetical protein [Bryobacteraceae bacterium]
MVRAVLYILVSIFAITFIRMVMGIIMRGFGDLLKSEMGTPSPSKPGSAAKAPTSGELKPCAKCGTYILTTTQFKSISDGKPVYFCSDACQKAFPV